MKKRIIVCILITVLILNGMDLKAFAIETSKENESTQMTEEDTISDLTEMTEIEEISGNAEVEETVYDTSGIVETETEIMIETNEDNVSSSILESEESEIGYEDITEDDTLECYTESMEAEEEETLNDYNEDSQKFAGGDGTLDNPYKISTLEQLRLMESYKDKNFVLVNDIDLKNKQFEPLFKNCSFSGEFDGCGYSIKNIDINIEDDDETTVAGLFGIIDKSGIVKNVFVENININARDVVAGGIAGINHGRIENCYVKCNIAGSENDWISYLECVVGGIAGYSTGEIYYCVSKEYDNEKDYDIVGGIAGGIVGVNKGNVNSCFSTCKVKGVAQANNNSLAMAGGIAGTNYGNLQYCKSDSKEIYATVISGGAAAGGIAGINFESGTMNRNYFKGWVRSYAYPTYFGSIRGGIVGCNGHGHGIGYGGVITENIAITVGDISICGKNNYGTVQDNYTNESDSASLINEIEENLQKSEWYSIKNDYRIDNKTITLSSNANIYVIDEDLGSPIVGAVVKGSSWKNGYITNESTTDENGYAVLPITQGGEEELITVEADGYSTYMNEKCMEQNGTYFISLKPTDGQFGIVYAKATIDNTTYDLLSDKVYMENTTKDIGSLSNKATLIIETKARGNIEKYALVQDGEEIVSSENGKMAIPIYLQDGKNPLTSLKAQKDIKIKAVNAEGNVAYVHTGLRISPEDAIDINEEDKSGSLSIGSKISVTIPENIPFLGGGNVSYGLENPLPFDITIERNGQVKIAINKSKSQSMEAFKDEYDQLSSRAQNLSNAAAVFGGNPEPFGAGQLSASISIKGYGEGYIDMNKPGYFEIKAGLIIKGKGSAKYTQYFMAGAVPIYVTVEAGAELSGSPELSIKCENAQVTMDGGVGKISGKIYLSAEAGLGVDNLVNVEVAGTGACNYMWKPKEDYTKVWLSAWLELRASCFGWNLDLWKSPEASYTIYETQKNVQETSLQSLNASINGKLYDSNAYTLMDRSYLKGHENSLRSTEITGTLQSNAYPNAAPKMLYAGGSFYLFWLQDIPTRSAENRAAVVYASSQDGVTWGEPKQLIAESENQTLDNGVDVYAEGSHIYVCWQDSAESYPSGTGLSEAVKKLNIAYAVIDATSGNVTSHQIVTSQAGCYMHPSICAQNGQVQISWVEKNIVGESIWSPENTEKLVKYSVQSNQTSELVLGRNHEKIVSMDSAVGSEGIGVIYSLDMDGDLSTIDDRKIYYDTRLGSGGSQMALTDQSGRYINPTADGDNYYWYSGNNIAYATIGSNAIKQIYTEECAEIGSDFHLLSNDSSKVIIWNTIEHNTEKVAFYGIKQTEDGTWSKPYLIEQTDSEMTGEVSGCVKDGRPYIAYMHIKNTADGAKHYSVCVTGEKDVADIKLNYASYDYGEFALGQTLPITVELTNTGTVDIEDVEVKWDGTSLGTENIQLQVGETKTIVLNQYTVSNDLSEHETHILSVVAPSESNSTDNEYTIGIGYTDMKVLCEQRLQNESTWFDISVLNDSSISSEAVLNIRADREDGKILYTEDLGMIEGGKGISMTTNLQKYENAYCTYFVEVVPNVEDVILGNNTKFVYTGYGTSVKGGDLVGEIATYRVIFETNGGSYVANQTVEEDMCATEPELPKKEGYNFAGWYLNDELYDFYEPVTKDITLEAVWKEYEVLVSPSASIASGSAVQKGTKVSLTCPAAGATIYYTTDGTEPTTESLCFTEPIEISQDMVIKAFAVKEGYKNSEIVTFTYTAIVEPNVYFVSFDSKGGSAVSGQNVEENAKATEPQAPTREGYRFLGWYLNGTLYDFDTPVTGDLTLEAGWEEYDSLPAPSSNIQSGSKVRKGTKISLTCAESGADIYYTTDGTEPTVESLRYTDPIEILTDITIRAFAVKEGYKSSEVVTFTYVVSDGSGEDEPGQDDNPEGVLPEDIPTDGIPEGLWIAGIDGNGYLYTGKAINPEVRVYDSDRRLTAGKDYTIAYKNNTKANDASEAKTAPSVVVKGKANYAGTETATFKILPVDLGSAEVLVENIVVANNGKVHKKVPTLTFNGKKLANKKDFTVSYPATGQDSYKAAGTYDVLLTAKANGNFTGTRIVKLTVTDSTLISKTSVKKLANQPYTGEAIMPKPKVTYKGKPLSEGTDYTLAYKNNTEIGTATVILTGVGAYAGTKQVNFKITGPSLKGAKVTIADTVYDGSAQTPKPQVELNGATLREGEDYTVAYQNNIKAGKATITISGIKSYSGTLKKTFHITAYDLGQDVDKALAGWSDALTAKYTKGGSKPELQLQFKGMALIAGEDYTVSYSNNKAVTSATTKKQPTVTIKGKGNFKGNLTKTFVITQKDLNDAEQSVRMMVADVPFKDKAGNYISNPVLTDTDGKVLIAGTDYEKKITYELSDKTPLNEKSKVDIGTVITVTVTGKGAYTGTRTATYCITKSDFSKAKISISPQNYTGKPIVLGEKDITVKIGNNPPLTYGTDYEIVADSYINNIKKGTASVTVIGKGNYGGMKQVKFKITAKKFSWFWRIFA